MKFAPCPECRGALIGSDQLLCRACAEERTAAFLRQYAKDHADALAEVVLYLRSLTPVLHKGKPS